MQSHIILSQSANRRFEPFDRFRHISRNKGRTLSELLASGNVPLESHQTGASPGFPPSAALQKAPIPRPTFSTALP